MLQRRQTYVFVGKLLCAQVSTSYLLIINTRNCLPPVELNVVIFVKRLLNTEPN